MSMDTNSKDTPSKGSCRGGEIFCELQPKEKSITLYSAEHPFAHLGDILKKCEQHLSSVGLAVLKPRFVRGCSALKHQQPFLSALNFESI